MEKIKKEEARIIAELKTFISLSIHRLVRNMTQ